MGTHSKWTPYRAAPGGPSPPYLTSLRSLSVRGHQAPSPKQKAGPTSIGAPTDAPGRTSSSGWARFRGQRRASHPTPSEAAAATQRQTTWAQARTGAHKSV
ncbi:hypothetical protein NDU88_003707 [Pleurodeles waltl]|uniref:Uncharacterized protein n=1 Tax=Pleurodeles waltl TaxID=8319 RepID=A0AAV7RJC0_PLEWA|nr:hypothetical protein NDU88_003707 [Pleurodeles waltl]